MKMQTEEQYIHCDPNLRKSIYAHINLSIWCYTHKNTFREWNLNYQEWTHWCAPEWMKDTRKFSTITIYFSIALIMEQIY